MGGGVPRGIPQGLPRERGRADPAAEPHGVRPAPLPLRAGEAGLRAPLRGAQPAGLGLDPGRRARADDGDGPVSLPGELDLHLIGEDGTSVSGSGSARTRWTATPACASPCGRRARAAPPSSATGTGGTPRPTGSSRRAGRASGQESPRRPRGPRVKLAIEGFDGVTRLKADPIAFRAEVPPSTASLVYRSRHRWSDDAWLARRAATDPLDGAALDLRGARRLVAPGARVARPRRRAGRARDAARLHARRAAARDASTRTGRPGATR